MRVSPLQVALPEMRALADAHDVVCTAVFQDRNDAVVREHAASVSHLLQGSLFRGARWPLRPPYGAIFLAGSSDAEADAWLDSLSPPPSAAERLGTKAGLAFVRKHGFQYVVRASSERELDQIDDWLFLPDPADRPLQPGVSLEPGRTYLMCGMSAPVFDKQGRVAFALSLSGFFGRRTGAQIGEIAAQVRAACGRITNFFAETPNDLGP
jgi:DNA-binding IclR family transcriptional regulator